MKLGKYILSEWNSHANTHEPFNHFRSSTNHINKDLLWNGYTIFIGLRVNSWSSFTHWSPDILITFDCPKYYYELTDIASSLNFYNKNYKLTELIQGKKYIDDFIIRADKLLLFT